MFFEFHRSSLSVFPLFLTCFSSIAFTLFFFLDYDHLCIKTMLNLVSQKTGGKKKHLHLQKQRALWCYTARLVTNYTADSALLIL